MDVHSSASKTALMVCAYRSRASRWDKPLFTDPWAEALAGAEGHAMATRLDRRWQAMEMWLALRTAYIDRLVGLAVDRLSIRQIVILGAGYDTRAARLPRAGVTFFEVDHPATQRAKRDRLGDLAGYPIDAARYVSCNFERQDPREDPIERLATAGFDIREPALVVWEGVVMYLTEGAIRTTAARLAAGLDPRSVVAFDFLGKRFVTDEQLPAQALETREYIGNLGEPVVFGTDNILPLVFECGFRWLRTIDFNELALEMLGDYQRDRHFRFQHIALAAVRTPVAGWP